MIKVAVDLQRKEGLPHYLDCYAAHTAAQQQHETFLDGVKAAGSAIENVAAGAVADGLGVNTKKLGAVVKAFRRKKPKFQTTKVPRAAKKLKTSEPANAAVKMTRQDFAKKLKSSGMVSSLGGYRSRKCQSHTCATHRSSLSSLSDSLTRSIRMKFSTHTTFWIGSAMTWTAGAPAISAAFLGSLVEAVEAL
jgi:hypothetical protein